MLLLWSQGKGSRGNSSTRFNRQPATAARVSNTLTMAPIFFAVPMAERPATPPPITSTLAGGMRPAAVIWPPKRRPNWFAASTTALQQADLQSARRANVSWHMLLIDVAKTAPPRQDVLDRSHGWRNAPVAGHIGLRAEGVKRLRPAERARYAVQPCTRQCSIVALIDRCCRRCKRCLAHNLLLHSS